jgi:lipopolysaccharide export system permease protein
MRILTRYVLFELLKVFLVSLTGMTLFFLLVGVFKEAYLQGLGFKQVLLLIPYVLPQALLFAIPAAVLFGACSVFGRLASGNEVIAVKASGISPMVLLWPAVVLAFLLSLAAVWVNDVAVSWGREGMTRVVIESVEEIAYSRLQQQRSYSTRQFSINVSDVDGRRLIRPTISLEGGGDNPPQTITCEEASMRSDLEAQTLTLSCRNGTVQFGEFSAEFPDTREFIIPLDEASRSGASGAVSPSNLALHVIPQAKAQQYSRIQSLEEHMAALAAYQMITGDFATLASPGWSKDQRLVTEARQRLYRLEMEPYRRWANGFSCLCFVMVGAPLAIMMRNSDFLTSFFMCFLPILIFYYPLMAFGVSQAKSGTFPSCGVWAGNLILAIIGTYCIRRVCRY